jgi:phosphate transport system substrate-binding protein
MRLTLLRFSGLIFIISVLLSCSGNKSNKIPESPTRGNIKICVDQSYQLMIEAQLDVFQSIYTYAKIKAEYKPEFDCISDLMNDSVRLIIVNKKLSAAQESQLKAKQIIARTTKIAYDALAFIVNPENPDSTLLYEQVKDIFTGKISKWKQINPKSKLDEMQIVFDNQKSSTVTFISDDFKLAGKFPSNCTAVNTNEEVVSFVSHNKNSIGIIGVNWISDPDDSLTHEFMKKIKVLAIGDQTNADGTGAYYKPYQAYIAQGTYPFIRNVYVICRESFAGLGTGFASFIAGEKGQLIILKGGLVPATMPIRLVERKTKF